MKTKIKYDKQFQRVCRILTIVTGILMLLFWGLLLFGEKLAVDASDWMIYACLVGYVSALFFPLLLVLYVDATVYLRRLKRNHFSVPEKKKDYDGDLSRLPRTETVENRYVKDSLVATVLTLVVYGVFLLFDILYLLKWLDYGESDATGMFGVLMVLHLYFPIQAVVFHAQKNTQKYVDEVDLRDNRKARISIMGAVGILIFVGCIGAFSVTTAHSMTDYIYKSRYGHYDKTLDQFLEKATLTVTSDDLKDGVWDSRITDTEAGDNVSPQISFDPVEGADHYVIYMVDESAHSWVHWLATDVHETSLDTGANLKKYENDGKFRYVGPYPPAGSGEHVYTVYVYALKGQPDSDLQLEFDEPSLSGDYLYYDYLNISERGNPNRYGNVLAYGYLSGVYERKEAGTR